MISISPKQDQRADTGSGPESVPELVIGLKAEADGCIIDMISIAGIF